MTASALLAGRWEDTAAPRWSIAAGCAVFGAGLLLTALVISPSPNYAELAATLALTGIGIGATIVPVTSAALSAVPPERSGMAASATNTSREIGAVLGVAVLGMLVNSQLNANLVGRLRALGIPANFQSIVINAIETGSVPSSRNASGAGPAADSKIVQEVIHAAYSAFYSGLHAALFLAAALVFAAGLFTLAMFGHHVPARTTGRQLQELTRPVLGIVVPHHGHDLGRVDHGPPVLALKADQAVRAKLHRGQLLGLGHREGDRPGPADEHGNRPVPTDNGIEQIAHRLAGHLPSPPGITTSMMPRDRDQKSGRAPMRTMKKWRISRAWCLPEGGPRGWGRQRRPWNGTGQRCCGGRLASWRARPTARSSWCGPAARSFPTCRLAS
jgi:hypothetical protein